VEVIAVLEDLLPLLDDLEGGQLTDDEREAIKVARAVLDFSAVLAGDDEASRMVFRVAALIPWERLAALMVTWRRLVVNVQRLAVELPALGPGVEVVESLD